MKALRESQVIIYLSVYLYLSFMYLCIYESIIYLSNLSIYPYM